MAGKTQKDFIHAKGISIGIYTEDYQNEYLSLTDIARQKSDDPTAVIQNWMRSRDVLEFFGLWENLHNPQFTSLEFEAFRNQAGANAFTMSPKKSGLIVRMQQELFPSQADLGWSIRDHAGGSAAQYARKDERQCFTQTHKMNPTQNRSDKHSGKKLPLWAEKNTAQREHTPSPPARITKAGGDFFLAQIRFQTSGFRWRPSKGQSWSRRRGKRWYPAARRCC